MFKKIDMSIFCSFLLSTVNQWALHLCVFVYDHIMDVTECVHMRFFMYRLTSCKLSRRWLKLQHFLRCKSLHALYSSWIFRQKYKKAILERTWVYRIPQPSTCLCNIIKIYIKCFKYYFVQLFLNFFFKVYYNSSLGKVRTFNRNKFKLNNRQDLSFRFR